MIYFILGPTSSGKSDYAIRLAKKIDGEVISVDSRQVYRGMDIGTGKVTRDIVSCHPERSEGFRRTTTSEKNNEIPRFTRNDKLFFSEGVRHHLLDVASPKRNYNVTHFLRDARKTIADIEKRGKTPILCGGTAFWVESLLFGASFSEVKPNKRLRAKLDKFSAEELFAQLLKKDPDRAASIDQKNKVRLIRALEIINSLGKVPHLCRCEESATKQSSNSWFAATFDKNQKSRDDRTKEIIPSCHSHLSCCHSREGVNLVRSFWIPGQVRDDKLKIIVLNPPKEILHARIEKRLKERLEQGMIEEAKHLHEEGVSWERLEKFGLEYRWSSRFLQGKVSHKEMEANLLKDIKHYAKRQLTFLRRLERKGIEIKWRKL